MQRTTRLTGAPGLSISGIAMRTPLTLRAAPAFAGFLLLTLAGCNNQPTNIGADETDDMKTQLATAKPVSLPPSIAATKSLRCADNSVVFVDFYSDGKSAGVHLKKDSPPTIVKADAAGKPMTADGGYVIDGSQTASSVKVTLPGKPAQSCDTE